MTQFGFELSKNACCIYAASLVYPKDDSCLMLPASQQAHCKRAPDDKIRLPEKPG